MLALTPDDKRDLARLFADQFAEMRRDHWVDPEVHAQHHDWVRDKKADEDEVKELRKRIVRSACIWAVPIILGFVFNALWREIIAGIGRALKG